MELHQLRYLVAVVDEGTFTAAGKRENVSQSGVSAQIRQLERELGESLLDRSGGGVALTDLGAAVLPHARAVLRSVEELRDAAADVAGLLRGSVSVGMVTGCSLPGFLNGLSRVHREHPELLVTLVEGPSDYLQRAVLSGELDLALAGWAGKPRDGLESATIVDEPTVFAVSVDHPLAHSTGLRFSDLNAHTLICLSRGTGVRAAFDRAAASQGGDLRVGLEASSPDTVAGLAARALGVAVLSSSMVDNRPDLITLPLSHPLLRSQLSLAWRSRSHQGAATRAVLRALERELLGEPA